MTRQTNVKADGSARVTLDPKTQVGTIDIDFTPMLEAMEELSVLIVKTTKQIKKDVDNDCP